MTVVLQHHVLGWKVVHGEQNLSGVCTVMFSGESNTGVWGGGGAQDKGDNPCCDRLLCN